MSVLKEIRITWFKNFKDQTFHFDQSVVGITGPNGIGKTNLLDAIYYLCYTKSYFQNSDKKNIQFGQEGFRINGKWASDTENSSAANTCCLYRDGKKVISQDEVAYEKVAEHIGKYHAVIIAPDDLDLINRGSEYRRKFVDGLLAQTQEGYLNNLLQYQKILRQKNSYLKQTQSSNYDWNLLDVYDEQLSQYGEPLLAKRKKLSDYLPEVVTRFYNQISGHAQENVQISYQPCCLPGGLLELLKENRSRDVELKRTPNGLHTEDWQFLQDGQPLKLTGSQGQKKSFLISLKLSKVSWLIENDSAPLLLLDDIFEKLDSNRLTSLFEFLNQLHLPQIFITHTSSDEMEKILTQFTSDFQIIKLGAPVSNNPIN